MALPELKNLKLMINAGIPEFKLLSREKLVSLSSSSIKCLKLSKKSEYVLRKPANFSMLDLLNTDKLMSEDNENLVFTEGFVRLGSGFAPIMEHQAYSLDDLFDNRVVFSMDEVELLWTNVLAGLSFIHSKGLVHLNINPTTIMASFDGRYKLTGFDSARPSGTKVGREHGTPCYRHFDILTEQSVGDHVDIWSLAVVVALGIVGETPFKSDMDVIKMRQPYEGVDISQVPEALQDLISWSLGNVQRRVFCYETELAVRNIPF